MPLDDRVHYMDNLRALAMLAGVVFHAALAYSPQVHDVWATADADGSVWVDAIAWFVHLFRMPLFFVIAGFFAALLVRRRGIAGMLRNRAARVLLPFLVFLPLVVGALSWLTHDAAASVRQLSPVLAWIKQTTQEQGSLPFMPTVAHLCTWWGRPTSTNSRPSVPRSACACTTRTGTANARQSRLSAPGRQTYW